MAVTKTTTDLTTLKINYLTEEMYENALENNQINANELYFTTDTNLTLAQLGIHMSTNTPVIGDGNNGDLWIVYSN